MQKSCAKTCDDVKIKEPFCAPHIFKQAAKHPKREHIEKDVVDAAVHKQVGNGLPKLELGGGRKAEPENLDQVGAKIVAQHISA